MEGKTIIRHSAEYFQKVNMSTDNNYRMVYIIEKKEFTNIVFVIKIYNQLLPVKIR